MKKSRLEVVGKARRRVDGRAKVTGQLKFADDLSAARMLHCKLLRSPHPHALVESIDTSKAKAHPGALNYGTGNTTSILATAQLASLAKLRMVHVPYRGDGPLMQDLVAGRIHFAIASTAPGVIHTQS